MPRSATWRPRGPAKRESGCREDATQRQSTNGVPTAAPESHLPSEDTTSPLAASPSHPIPQSCCRASGELFGAPLEASSKRGAKIRKVGWPANASAKAEDALPPSLPCAHPCDGNSFFLQPRNHPRPSVPAPGKGRKLFQLRIFLSLNGVVQCRVRNGHASRCRRFTPYAPQRVPHAFS